VGGLTDVAWHYTVCV